MISELAMGGTAVRPSTMVRASVSGRWITNPAIQAIAIASVHTMDRGHFWRGGPDWLVTTILRLTSSNASSSSTESCFAA
tara:strand:+ start:119 stop:358 length:240 start_codon:yes stop_codon:yes gene_type:complete